VEEHLNERNAKTERKHADTFLYFLRQSRESLQLVHSLDLKEAGKVPQCFLTCSDFSDPKES